MSYNLSIAVIALCDVLDLDEVFKIEFEMKMDGTQSPSSGKSTVQKELAKLKVNNKIQLFHSMMHNKDGNFEAVIPKVPKAE